MTHRKKILIYLMIATAMIIIIVKLTTKQDAANYSELQSVSWSYNSPQKIVSSPVIYKKLMIIQTESLLIALDLVTGNKVWESTIFSDSGYQRNNRSANIIIKGNILALQSQENIVAVYDPNEGNFLWDTYIKTLDISSAEKGDTEVYDIEIANDLVLVARHNKNLVAYDAKSGKLVWQNTLPERTGFHIMQEKEKILVGTTYQLLIFDKLDGNLIKDYRFDNSSAALYKDQEAVYVMYMNGPCSISALDAHSLTSKWCIKPSLLDYLTGFILMADDETSFFVANDDLLVAISKETGQVLWNSPLSVNIQNISVYGSSVYISGIDTFLIVDINSGKIKKAYKALNNCSCLLGILDISNNLFDKPNSIYQIDDNAIKSYELNTQN